MSNYTFCVITKVPDPEKGEGGNLATAGPLYQADPNDCLKCKSLAPGASIHMMMNLRAPVFVAGEIVILDSEDGREVCGLKRKPSKWSVEVEHFTDIEKAIERSLAIPEEEITP